MQIHLAHSWNVQLVSWTFGSTRCSTGIFFASMIITTGLTDWRSGMSCIVLLLRASIIGVFGPESWIWSVRRCMQSLPIIQLPIIHDSSCHENSFFLVDLLENAHRGKFKHMWWAYVCRSMFFSLVNKALYSTVISPRVLSILFKSVCEFTLLEAVNRRPSILPKNSLWSGSNILPSTLCPEGTLADFIDSSTLVINKFSIAVNTASWTLVSTDVIRLSILLHTLLTIFSSGGWTSNCG